MTYIVTLTTKEEAQQLVEQGYQVEVNEYPNFDFYGEPLGQAVKNEELVEVIILSPISLDRLLKRPLGPRQKSTTYYVDVPNPNNLEAEWINVLNTDDWEAVARLLERMGADMDGTVDLVTCCTVERDESFSDPGIDYESPYQDLQDRRRMDDWFA